MRRRRIEEEREGRGGEGGRGVGMGEGRLRTHVKEVAGKRLRETERTRPPATPTPPDHYPFK